MVNALVVLVWLLFGHCIADFALQTDFMVRAKNRHTEFGKPIWQVVLSAHASIHGAFSGMVLHYVAGVSWPVATGFGIAEFVGHWLIDFGKCDNLYSFNADQALHIACKVAWVLGVFVILMPAGIA